ncbi:NAD(P)/FAD-dependent oxidoreductase [Roseivirga sp.]|uniref:NAD(P)/FAD-dependent oxidoreductase n=1 Tax=Roseivirga sp. TaxID=1964215 RepID=UPI003B52EB69
MMQYDVIVVGGSYSGLSAAMTLGRSLRKTLIIDSGKPCNRYTPHSHNFITHDGRKPAEIASLALEQVLKYDTVEFKSGLVTQGKKTQDGFQILTSDGEQFTTKRLIIASGLKDLLPEIPGLLDCWGKSVIHCPYCHGYEVRMEKTGILASGDMAHHYAQLISHWTQELSIFTNGPHHLTDEQLESITKHGIPIIETEVQEIFHDKGQINELLLKDGSRHPLKAIYHGPRFEQHSPLSEQLGCELTDHGLIKVDPLQRTTIHGVSACGDASNMRSVSVAVSSGTVAGSGVNYDMILESF